jgi:hypothetical protein
LTASRSKNMLDVLLLFDVNGEFGELKLDDLFDLVGAKGPKDEDLVDAVQKLGPHCVLERL